ncbi:Protein rad9 [Lachnellula suecica]|uniref:Sister chromatid cohesion protein n=1 Tax=Lachnellula suecica TaxID=602035 RepID=A0A8T9C2M3_9HELO|nr:Protein rad9 [Lachnellula suecica]
MATNGYPAHNGTLNGSNGTSAMNGARYTIPRVLTVDEALPLTPFTSIVPFNSDIVPLPSVGLRSSVSLFPTQSEREIGRQGLESLNREAANPQNTSQRLQRTLDELKELLKPEGIAQYKFRTAAKLNPSPATTEPLKMTLSPFAQRLHDETLVEFSVPPPKQLPLPPLSSRANSHTPKSPTKSRSAQSPHPTTNQKAKSENSSITVQAQRRLSKPHVATLSQTSAGKPSSSIAVVIPSLPDNFQRDNYTPSKKPNIPTFTQPETYDTVPTPPRPAPLAENRDVPVKIATQPSQSEVVPKPDPETPKKLAPQPSPAVPGSGSNAALSVVIPDLPATFRADDYGVVPDSPDTPLYLSRKRKRSDIDGYEDGPNLSVDQREKADTAARNLREFIQEIFEAEDQIQPDNFSGNHFFTSSTEGLTLNTIAQMKVESLLQKIISAGRFSQAPLDELLRLQKLSEGAIKEAQNVDVKVDDSMGDSEVGALLQQVETAELGLKAARTSLRLMSGGREDKQLYSEDVIQSVLHTFKNVVENCIVPIVEMRASGSAANTFKLLSLQKKTFNNLLTQCRRVLSLLSALVANVELSETVINTLEFTTSRLIFVENAPIERDSVLGVAKFDSLRVVAMDALAQIFLCNPLQRQGIFDEILTSLEKLPVTKQSARQFKLAEGGSIQLVSALIMRLVQTSASKPDDGKAKRRDRALAALNGDDEGAKQAAEGRYKIISETRAEQQIVTAIQELREEVDPLLETAKANASYVVGFIVKRAMGSTKTGDAPYRNLLDLFVEDFITCLNSTDWPAAELLLRLFLFKMVYLAEDKKTAAPARNMALDLLGLMGSAISELNSHVRKTASSLEMGDDLAQYLVRLAFSTLENRGSSPDLVSWSCGPFRVSLEYLEERCAQDPQLHSATGYFMAEWASKISSTFDTIDDDHEDAQHISEEYGRLAYRLRMMILDRRWLSTEYSFDTVAPSHARLAYSITLLHSQFCQSFGRVLTILLQSMTSEQATVRSKSLRSVNQVLDTDPTILDREPAVMTLISRCSNDGSVQVRDSALNLVGKCISLRPALEEDMIPGILQRVNDSGIGVRKRAMRLSKDIYLRNSNREIRSSIADALLHRVLDLDDGVQELARQTIEEVWMSPFYQPTSVGDISAQFKLGMADHVALMVRTVQRGSGVASVLDKVLKNMLSDDSKNSGSNFKVCKALVATMFETIIDNSAGDGHEAPSARDALQVLMIFAKSNAKLFTPEQIQLLQPYVSNIGGGDDLLIYRSVVVIFRHVLPHLSKAHNTFLSDIRKSLIQTVARMGRAILDDLIACLWIISDVLGDFQHLTRLTLSSLIGIEKTKNVNLNVPANAEHLKKIIRLLLISGMCGKHCDFDPHHEIFKKNFPSMKGTSVSKLMCDTFAPFASPDMPLEVRKGALDAIGMVCQSWPKNFSSANIYTSFLAVFDEKNCVLEAIILGAFKDFLLLEEKRSEAGREALPGAAADPTAKLGVMGGGQGDGVAISIAQRFLPHIVRIALSRQDEQGLLATEVIASVARQGLVHPKECGVPLIALETSGNPKIAEIAFREHRAVHEKHETILEKEYMRAVQSAYAYQRDVTEDTHGATLDPFTSKLHQMIEILKISKVKNRKKFFETLCSRIDFDPAKIEMSEVPHHLQFSQFIIENMAFFEYATLDELLAAITGMEKVVGAAGTGIAHSIETEIFNISLDQPSQVDENGQSQPVQPTVDPDRLQLLTASSMLLSNLWGARTYLRRQYGLMNNSKRDGKGKGGATKDLNRAPVKAPFITGDSFWADMCSTMGALESEETMMNQCRAFVELLSVDHDFKVAAEGDEEAEQAKLGTPSEDEDGTPGPPGGSGRGRKRKSGSTPGGRKKRARSSSVPRGRGRPKGSGKKASVERSDNEEDYE